LNDGAGGVDLTSDACKASVDSTGEQCSKADGFCATLEDSVEVKCWQANPVRECPCDECTLAETQASWDNHAAAFGAMDVDKILLDYTEDSVIIVSDFTSGVDQVFNGLAGVRTCFEALFGYLETNGGFPASLVVPENGLVVESDQVFLIWKAEASGIIKATDTFITDADGKFAIQTVTLWTAAGKPVLTGESVDLNAAMAETAPEMVHWANHLDAFATGDIEKMVLDYNADAVINEYDFGLAEGKEFSSYTGEAGVRELFPKYFGWAGECIEKDTMDVNLPVIHVAKGFIYLHVTFVCAGIPKWTDTFLIDDAGMIKRQNIIFESGFEKTVPTGSGSGDPIDNAGSGAGALTAGVAAVVGAVLATQY